MSKLSDKEIAYFSEQLPEGIAVIDFRNIKDQHDFIDKYCPEDVQEYRAMFAISEFLKQVKSK